MSERTVAYVSDHSEASLSSHKWRNASNSAAYLLPFLKPDMRILDVGCGPGTITTDLARLVPQGQVIGIEYIPDPLEQARNHAAEKGIENVEFEVGDVHALKYADHSFDVVHAHQVLQHVADPVLALREMRRVAKPGGIVAVRDSASMTWYPQSAGLTAWKELSVRVARAKGGNPDPGSRLHVWACEAGFDRAAITCSVGAWCYSTPEERAWWSGLFAERIISSSFAKIAVDDGHCTQDKLIEIAQGWLQWGAEEDSWFGILHGEIICHV